MSNTKAADDLQKEIKRRNLPDLLKREFVKVKNDTEVTGSSFRIMQWNVLAQALTLGSDNFILCPPEAMDWEVRKLRMVEEIIRYRPSIICLEEVDAFSFLEESLKQHGYSGVFLKKPDSPCLFMENNMGPDGCAVFYLHDNFHLKEKKDISLKNELDEVSKQIALACKFEVKTAAKNSAKGGEVFYVAVTHLKAKAGFEKLRQAQGKSLLETMKALAGSLPVVICGDLNASQKEEVYAEFKKHDLGLKSIGCHLTKDGEEVAYTTWKIRGGPKGNHETCKTEDYIWYSKDKFVVSAVLSIPKDEEIGKSRLPSPAYPSDHFSLACDIQLV